MKRRELPRRRASPSPPLPGRALAPARPAGGSRARHRGPRGARRRARASSGRVVARIRTAPGPRSIEASAYGQVVVAHIPAGVVTILDAATLSVRAVLHGFGEPRYAAMHPGEPLAYVTDSALEQVVAIDLDRGRVVHRTRVPGPARHVSVDAGTTLWTVLGSAAERVAVLDLAGPAPAEARARVRAAVPRPRRRLRSRRHATCGSPRVPAMPSRSTARHGGASTRACGGSAAAARRVRRRAGVCRERRDGTLQTRRPDGSPVRTTRVPHGSYNVTFGAPSETFGHPAVVTPSLNEGTVAVLEPNGAVRFVRHVTRSAHDACVAQAG